jgi:hypothetical protein
MDPQNMFIDEDDDHDYDNKWFDDILSMSEEDHVPHRIEDGLPVNKKRANRDEEKGRSKRQKQCSQQSTQPAGLFGPAVPFRPVVLFRPAWDPEESE